MATFGDKLKEARIAAGLTQAQLAEASGIALGTIREYEQNKREPLLSKAGKLARAVNQPLDVFLSSDREQPAEEPARPRGRPRKGDGAEAAPKKGRGKK